MLTESAAPVKQDKKDDKIQAVNMLASFIFWVCDGN